MFVAKCVFTRVEPFQGAFISQQPLSEKWMGGTQICSTRQWLSVVD